MTDPTNDPSTQPTTTPQPLDLSPAPAPAPAGANSQEQQATQASPGRAAPAEPEGHQQEGDAPHTIAASPGRLEAEAQRAALEDELEQTFRSLGLLPADTRVKKLLLENALGRRLEEGSPTPEELDRAIRLLASLALQCQQNNITASNVVFCWLRGSIRGNLSQPERLIGQYRAMLDAARN